MKKLLLLLLFTFLLLNFGQIFLLFSEGNYLRKMEVVIPSFEKIRVKPEEGISWDNMVKALTALKVHEDLRLSVQQGETILPLLKQARQTRETLLDHKNAIHHYNVAIAEFGIEILKNLTPEQLDYMANNRDLMQKQINEAPLWDKLFKSMGN
jgi:hypothetical protein